MTSALVKPAPSPMHLFGVPSDLMDADERLLMAEFYYIKSLPDVQRNAMAERRRVLTDYFVAKRKGVALL